MRAVLSWDKRRVQRVAIDSAGNANPAMLRVRGERLGHSRRHVNKRVDAGLCDHRPETVLGHASV
jgi:hypothetical protein